MKNGLKKRYGTWPVIGTRSVIDTLVAVKDGQSVIEFFEKEFDLDMNSDPSISTTQHGTTIDVIFHNRRHILVITNPL